MSGFARYNFAGSAPGFGTYLLGAAIETLGDVQIPARVSRCLVRAPRVSGFLSELPPRLHHAPVQIELDDPVVPDVDRPDKLLVGRHRKVVPPDARPRVEVFAIFVEHLYARVPAIGDVDAARLTRHGDSMRPVELARARTAGPPFHQRLACLVELDDARVLIAIAHVKGAIGAKIDRRRPAEVGEVVVVGEFAGHAKRLHELLPVVRELEDGVAEVVDDPDVSLGVVRAYVDRVWSPPELEEVVPLVPRFDQLPVQISTTTMILRMLAIGSLAAWNPKAPQ